MSRNDKSNGSRAQELLSLGQNHVDLNAFLAKRTLQELAVSRKWPKA